MKVTSVSFHLSRFTGVETSPVNEELQMNFSELFMQHFKRKMCTGKNSFEQARISTYHSYTRHIRTAINFLDLALERGWQSTRSSPEHERRHRERHGTGDKDEKSVNGTQISIGKFSPGKRDYLFRNSVFSGNFPVERTEKSCSIYNPAGISGFFW